MLGIFGLMWCMFFFGLAGFFVYLGVAKSKKCIEYEYKKYLKNKEE